MTSIETLISGSPVIPLSEVSNAEQGVLIAQLLAAYGHSTVEIPLRHTGAIEAIRAVAELGGVTVGAGTIVHVGQIREVIEAGAKFGVSPNFDPEIFLAAKAAGFPYIPGVATPSETHAALKIGATVLKVFPAHTLGGKSFIDALSSVFPRARFMPSGGISEQNLMEYLSSSSILAVSGSWLTPRNLIVSENWEEIGRLLASHNQSMESKRAEEG